MSAVCLEATLRLGQLEGDFFFQPDALLGATYIPSKRGWYVMRSGGRRQWVEINRYGYRDKDWTLDKRAGTHRLALLGDSYLAGMEVPTEARVSEQLQAHLQDVAGRDCCEVMNFGVTGYGTAHELDTFRLKALQFKPDAAILFFYTGNDLMNNNREINPEPNTLHYGLDESQRLVRVPFTVRDNSVKRWLRHHSKLYLFLRNSIKPFQALHESLMMLHLMQDVAVTPDRAPVSAYDGGLRALRTAPYLKPRPAPIVTAWNITEALLRGLQHLAARHGVTLKVVVVPTKEEVLRTPPAHADPANLDMDASVSEMQAICDRLQLQCLQLVRAFREPGVDVNECYFPMDGHWTAMGHAIAERAIFEWLRKEKQIASVGKDASATVRRRGPASGG